MTEVKTPEVKTPDPETIIEFVDRVPPSVVALALVLGAIIGATVVYVALNVKIEPAPAAQWSADMAHPADG